MISLLKTRGNSSTGVHMLQRSGKLYRFRCNRDTLKRFTSVDVKPEYWSLFGEDGDAVFISELYGSIEEGAKALCEFIEKVCGIKCRFRE